ncbi:MAG TPA: alkaline phosphatase family protein [Chitinophagaceae bacterium]|nr:alkaline phosphatase family protein [Chitinophagaceae bacterium]
MKKIFFITLSLFALLPAAFAQNKTQNLVIVTLDGMRWQEVFGGVDSALIANKKFTRDSQQVIKDFWSDDITERRKKLFPFLWGSIAQHGQLYGDRWDSSFVNNANPYWFSYPGYNEIFTGYPDTAINSNDKNLNPNENVLEFINKQPGYTGKVAAFSTWDCFPYILNKWRSGIYVNSDVDTLHFNAPALQLINDMQFLSPRPIDVRPDLITYFAGREYLKAYKPKVLYIAFDETDDFAHGGMYDQYLKSAHSEDAMIADLWNILQSMPGYKNNTTLLVTCDHGRGDKIKEQWTSHGSKIEGSNQIWIAVMGPGIKALGEVKNNPQLYQRQLAATIAALLGFEFKPPHPVAPPIQSILP